MHGLPTDSPVVDSSGREGAGRKAHVPPIRGSRVSRNNEEMCARKWTAMAAEQGEVGEAEGKI